MTKPTGLQYHLQTGTGWSDVSPFVKYVGAQVEINRGRQDQFSTVQPGTLNATLDNTDGRFAPGDGYKLGVNYVTNPSFKTDLTGWTPNANLTAVWDTPTQSAKVTAISTAAALTYSFTVTLPASAVGKTFTLTTAFNASGTAIGKTLLQKVEFYNGASALISTLTRPTPYTLVPGWQAVATGQLTVPAGTVTAKVFPFHVPGGWTINDFVLIDLVAFTDSPIGRYFDGSQVTWSDNNTYVSQVTPRDSLGFFHYSRWNGVPDASTSTLYRPSPYTSGVTFGVAGGVASGVGVSPDNGIRARFPDTNNHNMVTTAEDASFEGGTVGSWVVVAGWGSIANSAVRAWDGTKSLLITSSTTGGAGQPPVSSFVCGLTYTMQVRVWVPAGQPDVNFELNNGIIPRITTSLKAQWVTMTSTFTLPLGSGSVQQPQVWWNSAGVAGQQVWVDGLHVWEGTTAPPSFITGPNPTFQDKFNGYLTAVPVQWPGGNNYSEVPITAADRLAPLARRTFKSVVQEEILYDSPAVYYTLGEAAGSVTAGDTSGNGQSPMRILTKGTGTPAMISFGTGTGPPTDGLTACQLLPANTTNYAYMVAQYPQTISNWYDPKTIIITISAGTVTGQQTIWRVFDTSHYWNTWDLGFDSTAIGKVSLKWNGGASQITSTNRLDDGVTHQIAIVFSNVALPNALATMYVDGVSVASLTAPVNVTSSVNFLQLGGDAKYNTPLRATLSHFALFTTALDPTRIAAQSSAQKNGFLNERSDQRIARYARWAGLAAADQSLETGKLTTTDHLDTSGQSAVTALESVASTEGGLMFVDRSGDLAFHSRAHRWDAAPFITLAPDDVGRDTQFILDNQLLVNQVTSSSKTVANLTISNTSSISAHGVYPVTLQLLSTSTDDVTYISQWYATVNASPKPRTNTILIDLLTSPQATSDLFKSLEVGATFAINGLPAQGPTSDWLLCVEGWREVISSTEWSLLINTSTTVPMWKIEDPIYGGVDSVNRIAY